MGGKTIRSVFHSIQPSSARCSFWSGASKSGISYLIQLHFAVFQDYSGDVFDVFRNNCRFWATRMFILIGVCMTAFKFSIPVDDSLFP
ncbi:hypothetical protein PV325_008889, partial [Microctonus aethiopoides]